MGDAAQRELGASLEDVVVFFFFRTTLAADESPSDVSLGQMLLDEVF